MSSTYDRALSAIDEAHAADPEGGELAYADSVQRWAERLRPGLDELMHLCARAQHLERWVIPRDSQPMDRKGYHAWRTSVAARQGERLQEILLAAGYEAAPAERAGRLVAKKIPRSDPDAQLLEDAACLVFLDEQIDGFADKQREKMIGILQKTWAKMSDDARALALQLPLSDAAKALVQEALG